MGWFIFAGDMLVMFFMIALVMWVMTASTRKVLDYSACIPLADDGLGSDATGADSGKAKHTKGEVSGEGS